MSGLRRRSDSVRRRSTQHPKRIENPERLVHRAMSQPSTREKSRVAKSRKKKPQRVKARLSRGLNDLMAEQQLAREWMFQRIRGVYERYGFLPLSTPAVEYLDVLLGSNPGDEATRSRFSPSPTPRERI